MTQVLPPRVVVLPAIRASRSSRILGCWSSDQLSTFLSVCDRQGLRFEGFREEDGPVRSSPRAVLVFEHWEEAFLREAWPVLQDLDGSFAIVLRTATLGQAQRQFFGERRFAPTWSELSALTKVGVDVVSGGHEGYDLTAVPPEVVFGELLRSRCEIERRLHFVPRALRYPFGRVNDEVARVAADAGFHFGLVGGSGRIDDPLRCPTLRPRRLESARSFAQRVLREVDDAGGSHSRLAAAGGAG